MSDHSHGTRKNLRNKNFLVGYCWRRYNYFLIMQWFCCVFYNCFFKMINIEGKSRVFRGKCNGGGRVMEGLR